MKEGRHLSRNILTCFQRCVLTILLLISCQLNSTRTHPRFISFVIYNFGYILFYSQLCFQELIHSKQKVLPIDIRRIEHEDFIDYEIEFVELSDDDTSYDDKSETAMHLIMNRENSDSEWESNSDKNSDKEPGFPSMVNLATFTDLLMRVRQHHQHKSRDNGDRRGRRRMKVKEAVFGRRVFGRVNMNLTEVESKGKKNKLHDEAGLLIR